MTKYSKVLSATLLATSVIAVSASASVSFSDPNAERLSVITTRSETPKFVMVDPTQIVTNAPATLKTVDKKFAAVKPKYKAVAINYTMSAESATRVAEDEAARYNGKKWTVEAPKAPGVYEFRDLKVRALNAKQTLATANESRPGTVKAEVVENVIDDAVTRFTFFVDAMEQSTFNAEKTNGLLQDKADLEWLSKTLGDLQAAYLEVRANDSKTVWGARPIADYYTALRDVWAEAVDSRPTRDVDPLKGSIVMPEDRDAKAIAEAAAPKVLGQDIVTPVLVTKDKINSELLKTWNYMQANGYWTVKISAEDAIELLKDRVALEKLSFKVNELANKVEKEIAAAEVSKWWTTYFQPVLDGKAVYNEPKQEVAAPAEAAPAPAAEAADTTATAEIELTEVEVKN